MEKTKKFLAYVVAFAAIVSLFIAGISVRIIPSYAEDAKWNLSTERDGVFTEAVATTEDGAEIDAGDINLVFDNDDAEQDTKGKITQDQAQVEAKSFGDAVKTELNKIAKEYDKDADSAAMQYERAFFVELTGAAENGAVVEFNLTPCSLGRVEFALFKADGSNDWQVLKPYDAAAANAGAAKDGSSTISFKLPGSGTIVFGQYSQAEADKNKAEGNVIDSGNRLHWTIYVIIVLGCIFVVLLVALVIVKVKAKKVAAVQAEQPVAATEIEEAPVQQPEEEEKKQE